MDASQRTALIPHAGLHIKKRRRDLCEPLFEFARKHHIGAVFEESLYRRRAVRVETHRHTTLDRGADSLQAVGEIRRPQIGSELSLSVHRLMTH